MSWLFGYNTKPQTPDFSSLAGITPPPAGGDGEGKNDGAQPTKAQRAAMEAYRFDSSALERAAAAAKELEKTSKHFFNLYQHDAINKQFLIITVKVCKHVSKLMT